MADEDPFALLSREPVCTGIAASWCPVHGDCTCPRDSDHEILWRYEPGYIRWRGVRCHSETARIVTFYDNDCPLHGRRSQEHAA